MYTYKALLVKVVDGDTIDLRIDLGFDIWILERVRLLGVDTPEVYGSNASETGKVSLAFVTEWFANRSTGGILVYSSKKYHSIDKYGRSLGTIYWYPDIESLNGIDEMSVKEELNRMLLDAGLARPY